MVRTRRGNVSLRKKKKYRKFAKGYTGANSKLSTLAMEQTIQSLNYSYKSRKLLKRKFRGIWIQRIKATLYLNCYSYSKFISNLRHLNILLDRKILSYLSFQDNQLFFFLLNKSSSYLL